MKRLKTFISPVCHHNYAKNKLTHLDHDTQKEEKLYWLDAMLDGGLTLPKEVIEHDSTFILLLSGNAGTGKSTFALELCSNLASNQQDDGSRWSSLYISTETSSNRIIENTNKSFGWNNLYNSKTSINKAGCYIFGENVIQKQMIRYDRPERFLSDVCQKEWERYRSSAEKHLKNMDHILVIDSLNIFQSDSTYIFKEIIQLFVRDENRPQILVLVVEGSLEPEISKFYEFIADAVFLFEGSIGLDNYFLRSFQILKIRTQFHALGKHIFKFVNSVGKESDKKGKHNDIINQFIPSSQIPQITMDKNGIIIFPSTHWHLSRHKRSNIVNSSSTGNFYLTPFDDLNDILSTYVEYRGFPTKRTTAFVGKRGSMKSHFAYYFMLKYAIQNEKNVLLISLREDEESAMETLTTIAAQEGLSLGGIDHRKTIEELIINDRLEILYNWPGCITPNEFFHRIYTSIARNRTSDNKSAEIVVLNGLDHLESRFPLCIRERTFVPALISLFRCHNICSIVISSMDGKSTDPSISNMGPLADLILEFSEPNQEKELQIQDKEIEYGNSQQSSVVSIMRVPAGQIGGKWGILWREQGGRSRFTSP